MSKPIAVVAAISLALLSGCSGVGSTSEATSAASSAASSAGSAAASSAGQAAAESCGTVTKELDSLRTDLAELQSKVPSDLPGAAAELKSLTDRASGLVERASDPQTRKLLQDVADNLNALQGQLGEAAGDVTQIPGVLPAVKKAKDSVTSLQDYCSSAT